MVKKNKQTNHTYVNIPQRKQSIRPGRQGLGIFTFYANCMDFRNVVNYIRQPSFSNEYICKEKEKRNERHIHQIPHVASVNDRRKKRRKFLRLSGETRATWTRWKWGGGGAAGRVLCSLLPSAALPAATFRSHYCGPACSALKAEPQGSGFRFGKRAAGAPGPRLREPPRGCSPRPQERAGPRGR